MWYFVYSSWVQAVRWHPSGRLDVMTDKGKILHYDGVPQRTFEALLHARSKGRFINSALKPYYWHAGTTP